MRSAELSGIVLDNQHACDHDLDGTGNAIAVRSSLECGSTPHLKRGVSIRRNYFETGIANSAPLSMLSGQRCIIDFCFV
jgi:hypothetical protein